MKAKKTKTQNDWPYLRRKALEEAEALGSWSNAGRVPTNIKRIARRRLVKEIRFTPLLNEGGISIEDDGFVISIATRGKQTSDLETRFESNASAKHLPYRLRFTLAHEIAHTFFFDLSKRPPKSKIQFENPHSLATLETACHLIAGALLLPRAALQEQLRKRDLRDPNDLSRIARAAYISRYALISRLAGLSDFDLPRAILASVRWTEDHKLHIESIWRHYSFLEMFTQLYAGKYLQFERAVMNQLKRLQIFGGSFSTATFAVKMANGTDRWTMKVESTADTVTTSAFIVSLARSRDYASAELD